MNIVYLASSLKNTGPTNQLYNIASFMLKLGSKLSVIVLDDTKHQTSLSDKFRSIGIPVENLGCSSRIPISIMEKKVKRLLRGRKIDLFHSQGLRADCLNARLSSSIKLATLRNYPQTDYRFTYGRFIGGFAARAQLNAFKKLDKIICVSESVQKNLQSLVPSLDAVTIRNGTDIDAFKPVNRFEKLGLRAKLNIPPEAQVFLTSLGRDNRKNTVYIARELERYLRDNEKAFLILIGDGEQSGLCQSILDGLDNVRFVGHVKPNDYFAASDFYLSASLAEGYPNAVLEALSSGLKVFLSDIGPHLEMKSLYPNWIEIFANDKPGNLSKLVSTISDLDENFQIELLRRSISSQIMCLEYHKLYRNLV